MAASAGSTGRPRSAKPGSSGARSPLVRRLILLWVAQNLLLVASSILRTLDYIDAFSLTRLRIAGFKSFAEAQTVEVLPAREQRGGRPHYVAEHSCPLGGGNSVAP